MAKSDDYKISKKVFALLLKLDQMNQLEKIEFAQVVREDYSSWSFERQLNAKVEQCMLEAFRDALSKHVAAAGAAADTAAGATAADTAVGAAAVDGGSIDAKTIGDSPDGSAE